MRFDGELLESTPRLLALHAREVPQKDELCGAFWGSLALRTALPDLDAVADQDAVADVAGTVLSVAARDEDRPAGERPRRDYRLSLPVTHDSALAGTAAGGVARAVGALSAGRLETLPVAGPWSEAAVGALIELALGLGGATTLVLNVGTRFLAPSHPTPTAAVELLRTATVPAGDADWDVGHFVGVLGRVRGPLGEAVLVADTYAGLGWHGVHMQPPARLADALRRPGQGSGGALLTVAAADAERAREQLGRAGLRVEAWDNGSADAIEAAGT